MPETFRRERMTMNNSDRTKHHTRREIIAAVFSLLLTAVSVGIFFGIYLRHYRYATRDAIRGN